MPSCSRSNTRLPVGYSFADAEKRWQSVWRDKRLFESEPTAHKYNWVVIELPPFANGRLHLGHVRNYVMADVSARFRRMRGYNVLYTSGFDSFGLPNEAAAIQVGKHPLSFAQEAAFEMSETFRRLGLSHDERRIIGYHEESFYRWVQWVFLVLFDQGLAYRIKAPAIWCSVCHCTLAEALAMEGKCWRCHNAVEIRSVDQWLIKESVFAEEMLDGIEGLKNWPSKVKQIHKDWIGRRYGMDVQFAIKGCPNV